MKKCLALLILTLLTCVARVHADAAVIHSEGLDSILVDPKDHQLRDALKLLNLRLVEIPLEIGEPGLPVSAFTTLSDLLLSSTTLRINPVAGDSEIPISADLTVRGDDALVKSLDARFMGLLQMAGAVPDSAGSVDGLGKLSVQHMPGLNLYHGVRNGRFTLAVHTPASDEYKPDVSGLPSGVKPAISMAMDFAQFAPVIEKAIESNPMQAEQLQQTFATYGMTGDHPMSVSMAIGYAADRAHGFVRARNASKITAQMGMSPPVPLTAADFQRIPQNATMASVSWIDLPAMPRLMFNQFAANMPVLPNPETGEPGQKPDFDATMQMVESHTGFHLQRDFFDHLGKIAAFYTSDMTGGGGFLSSVVLIDVANPEALQTTLNRFAEHINQFGMAMANGYVQARSLTVDGASVTVLAFPGLPVPLEISVALRGKTLIAAATPQALTAASKFIATPGPSLLDNPQFIAMGGDKAVGAYQVSYTDTPRFARQGYGLMSLGMSAVSNGLRSRTNVSREPGVIMPDFDTLMKDVKAAVSLTRMEGDDAVTTMQFDRSWLVNGSAAMGSIGGSPVAVAMAAMFAGVTMPALAKARESARELKSSTQVRHIAMAVNAHAADKMDKCPTSVSELVAGGYVSEDLLQSPFGPMGFENGDYWLNTTFKTMGSVPKPQVTILAYDRACYALGQNVPVAFYDGHSEILDTLAFESLMAQPQHAGIDFESP